MAFFQTLPARPNLGAALGQSIGQGLQGGLSAALQQVLADQIQAKKSSDLQQYLQSPAAQGLSQEQRSILSGIPSYGQDIASRMLQEQGKSQQFQQEQYLQELKHQRELQEAENTAEATRKSLESQGYDVPKEHILGTPASTYTFMANKPGENKKDEGMRKASGLLENISAMRTLLPYTGATWYPSKSFMGGSLNRTAVEKRAQFKALGFSLESFYRDLAAKGNMPLGIFNKLMDILPSENLSERENEGRLKATETIIRNNFPELKTSSQNVTVTTPDGRIFRNVPREKAMEYEKHGAKIS